MEDQSDRDKAGKVALLTVALGVPGFFARRQGTAYAAQLDELRSQLATERDKDKRDALVAQQEGLQTRTSYFLTFGTTAIAGGASALLIAVLLLRGMRLRAASWLLIIPLLTFCIAGISKYDMDVAWLVPATVALAAGAGWFALRSDEASDREADAFRRLPARLILEDELEAGEGRHPYRGGDTRKGTPRRAYRELFLKTSAQAAPRLLRKLDEMPPELARILPQIGEGRPVSYLQLRAGLAYTALVEADAYNLCDYAAVVMKLDEPAPSFVARPFSNDDGKGPPASSLKFRDDEAFGESFVTELGQSADPKKVRAFLSADVRAELLAHPSLWLFVSGSLMALVRYGRLDAAATDKLVESADYLFELYGADGGPSLLEPDGLVGSGQKKKKKKKSAGAPSAEAPAT